MLKQLGLDWTTNCGQHLCGVACALFSSTPPASDYSTRLSSIFPKCIFTICYFNSLWTVQRFHFLMRWLFSWPIEIDSLMLYGTCRTSTHDRSISELSTTVFFYMFYIFCCDIAFILAVVHICLCLIWCPFHVIFTLATESFMSCARAMRNNATLIIAE